MQINVKSNIKEITKFTTTVQKKQIPFATSRALNDTAFNIARKDLPKFANRIFTGGAVQLNHAGSKKFETTSGGITVQGSVTTEDINLSNINSPLPNEVDGTRGTWTMQEGANDLFLINRNNGKKYKFNLTEIT